LVQRDIAVPDPSRAPIFNGFADAAAEGVVGEGDELAVRPADLGEAAGRGPAVGPGAAVATCLFKQVAFAVVLVGRAAGGEELAGWAVAAIGLLVAAVEVAGGVGDPQVDVSAGTGRGDQVTALVVLVVDGAAVEVLDAAQAQAGAPGVPALVMGKGPLRGAGPRWSDVL